MWKKVGIDADIEIVEYAKYFELNRGNKLPEATLYSWDNATGDPEMFTGYLLNPNLPFSAWKEKEIGDEVAALFAIADYDKRIAAYKEINKKAVEYGAIMPLLQSVITIVRKKGLEFRALQEWLDSGRHHHQGLIALRDSPAGGQPDDRLRIYRLPRSML